MDARGYPSRPSKRVKPSQTFVVPAAARLPGGNETFRFRMFSDRDFACYRLFGFLPLFRGLAEENGCATKMFNMLATRIVSC